MSKPVYQKLQLRDQILLRPDTYIGSVNTLWTPDMHWIAGKESFEYRMVRINDGLLRLVIEVISNAIDNVWRSVEAKNPADRVTPHFIKITFDENQVSVWNDGANISTHTHETEQVPIPELIFGHLLTSSNYNDNEERKTSGKNGIGAKACNLFSKSFSLRIFNRDEKVLYKQDWTDNMKQKTKPILERKGFPTSIEEGKNGYTCITFSPDFERFGETKFNEEHLSMIRKLCIDAAMTVSFNKVKVVMNGETIPINDLSDYVNYYFPRSGAAGDAEEDDEEDEIGSDDDEASTPRSTGSDENAVRKKVKEEIYVSSPDCKVVLRPSKHGEYTQVSFVNGIQTTHGGVHVEAWCEAFFRPLVNRINGKKDKTLHIDIRDVKKHFFVFVFASVDKPKFDSQSKTRLIGPEVKTDVKSSHLSRLMKWSFVEKIEESLKIKELATLRKSTERKKGGKLHIEGFDDAYYAGKKQSQDCTLFITEGLSAKQYIVIGLSEGLPQFGEKAGRDYIGVLPIRGKFLNVRNATAQTLSNNKEVKNLIQVLGLQFEVDYSAEENRKKLRYGRLVCGCDNDVDGFHITGLLYNFFQTLFPSLLKKNDFFFFMRTPIIKIDEKSSASSKKKPVEKKKTESRKVTKLGFFNLDKAREYIQTHQIPKTKIEYFKGLGTSTKTDIKEDFGRRIVQMVHDEKTPQQMEYIFSKDHTAYRKEWLKTYDPTKLTTVDVKDYELEPITVQTFLNEELIQFSIDDCKRSIPHLLDGFKESHRKVMFTAFKRNIRHKLKVAQFAGSVAEMSEYHHGEVNLYDTIIKLAQSFIGTNNIPLLVGEGNFGSYLENGKDAASARYIYTRLDPLTRLIFREEDEDYLPDRIEDGNTIEKEYYLPIIPMVLVNPTLAGIGTGWSCSIPGFNPRVLIEWIRFWLQNLDEKPELKPWYKGFTGSIELDGSKVTTTGVYEEVKKDTYLITALPIGKRMLSISKYKEQLEELREKGLIRDIRDNSTDENVHFTISVPSGTAVDHKKLGLIDTISMTNMVLFDSNQRIRKYHTPSDILDEYCVQRLELYDIRRKGEIVKLEKEELVLSNKIRFIKAILNDEIVLKGKDETVLSKELESKKYHKVEDGYDYLLTIQVRSMTAKKLEELEQRLESIRSGLKYLRKVTDKELWLTELKELEKALTNA